MIIYIVTNSHFNNRDKERFGIDFFLSKNFGVVVIDVQDYTNPELKFITNPVYKEENNLFVVKCPNFDNVKKTIKLHGKGVAMVFLSNNIQSTKIKRYLKLNKIKIGIVHGGMIPTTANNAQIANKIFSKFKEIGLTKFLFLIYSRVYSNIFSSKRYDFLITSNYEKSVENYNIVKPKSIIETHCLDYDLSIKHKNDKSLIEEKYVVFLDQYLLNHTDFIRTNKILDTSPENYYKELNQLFNHIENKFNFKVVIAAHPRADIKDYNILFDGRKIEYRKSALLVKHCEFSITHYSTAINFSVIYQKPILFITSNDLIRNNLGRYVEQWSSALEQSVVNMSNNFSLPAEIKISKEAYDKYKKQYIKKNNLESLSWDIFYKTYLKRLN
jgi:hypothetical protein